MIVKRLLLVDSVAAGHQSGHAGAASRFTAAPVRPAVQHRVRVVEVVVVQQLGFAAPAEHELNGATRISFVDAVVWVKRAQWETKKVD